VLCPATAATSANVSGLLDAGMPLALVAAVAGHKTIVMTLHYHRESVGLLRRVIRETMDKRGAVAELQDLDRRLEEYQNYEEYLVSTKQGFDALRNAQAKGNIIITLSGICPGTTCDKGLDDEYRATCGGDVPGSRCALCKYRVYGPPFLPGLVLESNSLLLELQAKAKHLCEQRQKAKRLEDDGHEREADLIRGELDLLDRETELDIKVLFRLDEMISESAEMANASRTAPGNGGFALMAPEEGQKKLVGRLELAAEFDLLKAIAEDAAILSATRHVAPTTAVRRLKDRFLGCLRKNGVEPYLLDLDEQLANEATLQLARLLELAVTDPDTRERVLDGKVSMRTVPGLEKGVAKLMCDAGIPVVENGKRPRLLPGTLGLLSGPETCIAIPNDGKQDL
ncbi:MAG TPA: hypothetical protein VEC99_00675, partial [Clostridia bacterium]|nr:hypothetical protein [Clostridia bacterium]